MTFSSAVRVTERSAVGEARRAALEHAERLGWDEVGAGNAALVATELASNLVKHAGEGVISISSQGLESERLLIVAVDRGPGMDVARALEDGYSTAGTPGGGLGAVARLANEFDITSGPEGTVVAAELRARVPGPSRPARIQTAAVCVPKEGETASGDAWDTRRIGNGIGVLVCDGLGHGRYAGEAAAAAVEAFRASEWPSARDAVAYIHDAHRATRGAAAAVALMEPEAGRVRFCGVGNISALIVAGDSSRHLVSHNGILGHSMGRRQEFEYACEPGSTLILHSDGLSSRWRPSQLGDLWGRRPGLVAGAMYRDFERGSDDVVITVVQQQSDAV